VEEFEDFFERAAGTSPHGYQARLARDGLPAVVQAPTGAGKTGIVLAWLWRRLHERYRDETPRRLVYALPQRSLVEQVVRQAERWLANWTAPVILEALIPGRMQSHAGTAEVSRGAARARGEDGVRSP
jgi:reverse gyrase